MGKQRAITWKGIHKNNVSVSMLTVSCVRATSSIYESENVPDLSYIFQKSAQPTEVNRPSNKLIE